MLLLQLYTDICALLYQYVRYCAISLIFEEYHHANATPHAPLIDYYIKHIV